MLCQSDKNNVNASGKKLPANSKEKKNNSKESVNVTTTDNKASTTDNNRKGVNGTEIKSAQLEKKLLEFIKNPSYYEAYLIIKIIFSFSEDETISIFMDTLLTIQASICTLSSYKIFIQDQFKMFLLLSEFNENIVNAYKNFIKKIKILNENFIIRQIFSTIIFLGKDLKKEENVLFQKAIEVFNNQKIYPAQSLEKNGNDVEYKASELVNEFMKTCYESLKIEVNSKIINHIQSIQGISDTANLLKWAKNLYVLLGWARNNKDEEFFANGLADNITKMSFIQGEITQMYKIYTEIKKIDSSKWSNNSIAKQEFIKLLNSFDKSEDYKVVMDVMIFCHFLLQINSLISNEECKEALETAFSTIEQNFSEFQQKSPLNSMTKFQVLIQKLAADSKK